jgi:serine/threonine protein kinase
VKLVAAPSAQSAHVDDQHLHVGTPPPPLVALPAQVRASMDACFNKPALTMGTMDLASVVKRSFSDVAVNGFIGRHDLAQFTRLLTKRMRTPENVFGGTKSHFLCFDFDGNGKLDEHEVVAFAKACLLEYRRHCSPHSFDVPSKAPAKAGYKLIKEIGRGNQSKAHLVRDAFGQFWCMKAYDKTRMQTLDIVGLQDEYNALRSAGGHPNVASAIDIFQDSGCFYLVQDFYEGGDMTALRGKAKASSASLDESWWKHVFKQCFEGLAHLHRHAIIHCDIKEPNIMIKRRQYEKPEVVLIDLGMVRNAVSEMRCVSGTAGYIAPEIWTTGKTFPGSDIFAMGTVIMQLVLDRVPPHHNPPRGCSVLPGGIFTSGAKTLEDVCAITCKRTPPFHELSLQYPLLASLLRGVLDKDVVFRPCAHQVLSDVWFSPDYPPPKEDIKEESFLDGVDSIVDGLLRKVFW